MEDENTLICFLKISAVHCILCPGKRTDLLCISVPNIYYNMKYYQKDASKPQSSGFWKWFFFFF